MARWLVPLLFVLSLGAQKYTGPLPPKPDLPYLLHAGNLVATEVGEAHEENRKNESIYTVAGAASTAKTPMSEPILIMESKQLAPDRMELYRVEPRNGVREVSISQKKKKGASKPVHLVVTPLGGKIYRVEAGELLENGEYCLSPQDSNKVFCFAVY